MEWFWFILASIGAGIGTGLAGLSAATVMVPMLIVLCPSFSGETGAYQATAVALASDILGSAVTTYTYAKNKNIDLKRGWLIMTCILVMCTVGSYVAFIAGNTVLGGFTLFLTFCIGIRFLVKPDTSRENQVQKGTKLRLKGIIISLVCGIPIGFGTGFVGTGGGMMMLIVFSVTLRVVCGKMLPCEDRALWRDRCASDLCRQLRCRVRALRLLLVLRECAGVRVVARGASARSAVRKYH